VNWGTRASVRVEVGVPGAPVAVADRPRLCVVGVAPEGAPWLADAAPHAVVRETRFRSQRAAVEHLRYRPGDSLQALSGLDGEAPSLLRDAVAVALSAGAGHVDALVARSEGASPHEVDREDVHALLLPFLAVSPGAVMVLPDAGGPRGRTDEGRRAALVRAMDRYGGGWREHQQIGLLDASGLSHEALRRAGGEASGQDVALCRWVGEEDALRSHGWRSAAAAVGALLAGGAGGAPSGIVGRSVALPPGRRGPASRASLLSAAPWTPPAVPDLERFAALALDGDDRARLISDAALRAPVGVWSLPALHLVKAVHLVLVSTANEFVFEGANDVQALALAAGLSRCMNPFISHGLLTGPENARPRVEAGVEEYGGQWGLSAIIEATLLPWSRRVTVRVTVRPSERRIEGLS